MNSRQRSDPGAAGQSGRNGACEPVGGRPSRGKRRIDLSHSLGWWRKRHRPRSRRCGRSFDQGPGVRGCAVPAPVSGCLLSRPSHSRPNGSVRWNVGSGTRYAFTQRSRPQSHCFVYILKVARSRTSREFEVWEFKMCRHFCVHLTPSTIPSQQIAQRADSRTGPETCPHLAS